MTLLPDGLARFTGANTFPAEDYAGNIFYAFQGPNDTGIVTMVTPDGTSRTILTMPPGSGRPCFEWNPSVGLQAVGNKETGNRSTPPRYPIAEYVPFPIGAGPQGPQGPKGDPGPSGGMVFLPEPRRVDAWHGRAMAANEGVLVSIPALFSVPPARIYKVRLSVQAGAANVTARVGTFAAPYFLTQTTQFPDVRIDIQGDVPGEGTWISIVGGSGLVWMQIVAAG